MSNHVYSFSKICDVKYNIYGQFFNNNNNSTDLNIIVIKNNKILYINNILQNACRYNHIEVLEWLLKHNIGSRVYNILFHAATYGNIKILNWFENKNYHIYDQIIIDVIKTAAFHKHVNVFEWFKNSIYNFKYDKSLFLRVVNNKCNDILEWLKKNNYAIKYYMSDLIDIRDIKIFKFFCDNVNIKKIIKRKISLNHAFLKFKIKNNYIKGYNKN